MQGNTDVTLEKNWPHGFSVQWNSDWYVWCEVRGFMLRVSRPAKMRPLKVACESNFLDQRRGRTLSAGVSVGGHNSDFFSE